MEPPKEILQSETSPGSPSSSSSVQENTARAVLTPPSTPSVSRTYNYSLYSSPTTPQRCPTPCSLRPNLSASCLQPRITVSRGNLLYMAAPATPRSVQRRTYVSEWHTYDATAPPARRLYQFSIKATSGNRSKGKTSRPPSEPSYNKQALQSVSPRQKSARTPSVQGGAWLSSWSKWTQTPSAWWGGG